MYSPAAGDLTLSNWKDWVLLHSGFSSFFIRRQAIIKIIELCSRQYKLLSFAKAFTCIEFVRDGERNRQDISAAHSSSSCSRWLEIDCNLLCAHEMSLSPRLHQSNPTFRPPPLDSTYNSPLCSIVTFPHDNSPRFFLFLFFPIAKIVMCLSLH